MTTRIACVVLLAMAVFSVGLAQTAGSEKPTLLQDRGLQLGVQIGGFIGDNEQPKEMKIIRLDNLTVQLFETFSPRVFLDYGLMKHVRGQFGASFGKLVGRYYSTSLVPIDYRFIIIPYYARGFSPYAYLGIGGLHYDVTVGASRKSAGVETTGWAAYMPGGLGFVSEISDRLALDFNVGYSFIFNDDVNGHRAETNDSYYSGRFGVRFPLASKTSAERQQEELQKRLVAEEPQRKAAEGKVVEDQQRKELEAKKAAEEKRLKEQEAQKALEAQKAQEAQRALEAQKAQEAQKALEAQQAQEAQKAVEAQKAQEAQKALEAQKAQEVKKPAKPVAPKPEQPKEARKGIVFESVYFKIGSSELAPSEQAKLDAIAKTMQENPDVKVAVSGNTDATGSRALNEKLADARAEVVKSYLIGKGVSGERLTTNGYAFDKPAAPNSTVRGRYLNRRTELDVVK